MQILLVVLTVALLVIGWVFSHEDDDSAEYDEMWNFIKIFNGENTSEDRMVDCISDVVPEIVKQTLYERSIVLNLISSTARDVKNQRIMEIVINHTIMKFGSNTNIVIFDHQNIDKALHIKLYTVLVVDNLHSFRKIFKQLKPNDFDFQGYFLIVLISDEIYEDDMKRIFEDLWSKYIMNADIVVNDGPLAKIFTYFPFTESHCEKVYPVLLDTFDHDAGFEWNAVLYPEKLKNLHKCPITVVTFNIPPFVKTWNKKQQLSKLAGIEALILHSLAREMNFTLEEKVLNDEFWGNVSENGKSSGAIQMVMDKKANLTAGFFTPTSKRKSYKNCFFKKYLFTVLRNKWMSSTKAYHSSNLVWVLAPDEPLTPHQRLFKPFQPEIWYLLLLSTCIGIGFAIVVEWKFKIARHFVFGKEVRTPILDWFNSSLGGSMRRLPRRNFARIMLGLFLIFSLILRNAYTGTLFHFVKTHAKNQKIKTIDDMIDRNYTFAVLDTIEDYFEFFSGENKTAIILNKTEFDAYKYSIAKDDRALLASTDFVAFWNQFQGLGTFYHYCKDIVASVNLVFYLHKTSCLTQQINEHLINYDAYGFNQLYKHFYIDNKSLKEKFIDQGPQKLTIDNIKGAIFLLVFGLIISTIPFFFEIACEKLWKTRNNGA